MASVSNPVYKGVEQPLEEIRLELHRLRESQMILLLKAEACGLEVPRSCCPHAGDSACLACTLLRACSLFVGALRSALPILVLLIVCSLTDYMKSFLLCMICLVNG